jgi:hypothetical protein
MGRTERQREIARRRKRKTGLAKVRERFAASKNEGSSYEPVYRTRIVRSNNTALQAGSIVKVMPACAYLQATA